MRSTIVKNGIQERLNYILGTTDTDSETPSGQLTVWSIQSSMIANLKRIVKGIVGNSPNGRVMSGLQITQVGTSSTITISKGIGFTLGGEIITLTNDVQKDLGTVTKGSIIPIYLMYAEAVNSLSGHLSNIQGATSQINIVNDEKCIGTSDTAVIAGQIAITNQTLSANDGLYIGQVTITQATPTITMNILHSVYNNNQNLGPATIEYTYNGSFSITGTGNSNQAIHMYDGVANTTSIPVIGTGNRVIYLQVKRNVASVIGTGTTTTTTTPPNLRPSNMITNIQIWGWQKDGAGATLLYDGLSLPDSINTNHVDVFAISDLIIPDSVYGLTIKSSTANWETDWTPTTYGPATITMVIQKLTV